MVVLIPSMIGSTIITSIGMGVVFELGRFYERNFTIIKDADGSSSNESRTIRPRHLLVLRLKVNTIIAFLFLMIAEYFLVPRKYNPFSYFYRSRTEDAASSIISNFFGTVAVFSLWTVGLIVGYGTLIVGYRSLRHAQLMISEERRKVVALLKSKNTTTKNQEKQSMELTKPSIETTDSTELSKKIDGSALETIVSSQILSSTCDSEQQSPPPAVWSNELKGAVLENNDVQLAQQAIQERWKRLEGRNEQLEQLRTLKQQQEERLKNLRLRRQQLQQKPEQLLSSEEQEIGLNDREEETKTVAECQEESIFNSLERVASAASEVTILVEGDGEAAAGDDASPKDDDQLAEERDRLRQLTDELEALKLDMHEYKEECQRRENERVEELERQRELLNDREDVLMLREQGLDHREKVLQRKRSSSPTVSTSHSSFLGEFTVSSLSHNEKDTHDISSENPATEESTEDHQESELVKTLSGLIKDASEATKTTESFLCETKSYLNDQHEEQEEETRDDDITSPLQEECHKRVASDGSSSVRVELVEVNNDASVVEVSQRRKDAPVIPDDGDDNVIVKDDDPSQMYEKEEEKMEEERDQVQESPTDSEFHDAIPFVGDIVDSTLSNKSQDINDNHNSGQEVKQQPSSSTTLEAEPVVFVGDVVDLSSKDVVMQQDESARTTPTVNVEAMDAISKAVSTVLSNTEGGGERQDDQYQPFLTSGDNDHDHLPTATDQQEMVSITPGAVSTQMDVAATALDTLVPRNSRAASMAAAASAMWTLDPSSQMLMDISERLEGDCGVGGSNNRTMTETNDGDGDDVDLATGIMNLFRGLG